MILTYLVVWTNLLLVFPITCIASKALLNILTDYDIYQARDSWRDNMENLFGYVMPNFRCCYLIHDDSLFSQFFINEIYLAHKTPPVVLVERNIKDMLHCRGYVIVSSQVQQIPRMIESLPKWADHRILAITQIKSKFLFHKLLDDQTHVFGDAETFVFATNDPDKGYRLGQPIREFELVDNITVPWTFHEQGYDDFQGREMNVMTSNCSVFSWLKWPIIDPQNNSYFNGVEMRLLRIMVKHLNITLNYHLPPNNASELILFTTDKWYKSPLVNSKVDMAFCGIRVSASKFKYNIQMTDPLYRLCFKFVIPRPKPLSSEWYGIFLPFSPDLWYATGAILGGTSVILQRVSMLTHKFVQSKVKKYEGLGQSLFQLVSILVLSSVPSSNANQGATRHILTWFALFTVLLTTSFSSSLVSYLSNTRYSQQPTTIKQFIKKGYHWIFMKQPDFKEVLNLSNNFWHYRWRYRTYRAVSKQVLYRALKDRKHVLYGAQLKEGFILPMESIFPGNSLQDFEATQGCVVESFDGYAFRMGSPFVRSINTFIRELKEYGIANRIAWKVETERAEKLEYTRSVLSRTKPKITPPHGLKIENLIGILQVWALGLGISILVFILEVLQRFNI